MPFANDKKTFLAKLDKSKKGDVDTRVLPLLQLINAKPHYYTTSSCSGRVYFWKGTGKKNETEWVKVSHELISSDFFDVSSLKGILWLRVEPFILHVACKDVAAANALLIVARKVYKKSCLLTASTKIIVEIRGSEWLEMPYMIDGSIVFSGDRAWLVQLMNQKLQKMWIRTEQFRKILLYPIFENALKRKRGKLKKFIYIN